MPKYVTKTSGERVPFDPNKFTRSLKRVGADDATIKKLTEEIQNIPSLQTTKDIYSYAYHHLLPTQPGAAIRYNLKNALYELGPMGFPFEQYTAQILSHLGYKTKTNITLYGNCVTHEIDVIVKKDNEHGLIECKFHAVPGEKINIKIPLYVRARYEDIVAKQAHSVRKVRNPYNKVWVVSNTQFTDASRAYAQCMDMHIFGWGSPQDNGLEVVIDSLRLHPITILHSLSHKHKQELIKENVLLCKDLRDNSSILAKAGVPQDRIQDVLKEAETLFKNHDKTS